VRSDRRSELWGLRSRPSPTSACRLIGTRLSFHNLGGIPSSPPMRFMLAPFSAVSPCFPSFAFFYGSFKSYTPFSDRMTPGQQLAPPQPAMENSLLFEVVSERWRQIPRATPTKFVNFFLFSRRSSQGNCSVLFGSFPNLNSTASLQFSARCQ